MQKLKLLVIILAGIVLFSSMPNVMAFGPTTHMYITSRFLEDQRVADSPMVQLIKRNRQCADAGFVFTDVTVLYYYTSGQKYEATHAWSFQEELMKLADDECSKAFSYGVAEHLVQDSVSHNLLIPRTIRTYFLPNWIIHAPKEATYESHIIRDYPQEYKRIQTVLKPLLNNPELMNKVQEALTKSSGFGPGELNAEEHAKFFDEVLGDPDGFYTRYFALPDIYKSVSQGNWPVGLLMLIVAVIFIILAWRFSLLFIIPGAIFILIGVFFMIGGLAGLTNISDFDQYMQISIDRSVEVFQPSGWDNRYLYDPTGFNELRKADSEIAWIWGIVAVLMIAGVGWYFGRHLV